MTDELVLANDEVFFESWSLMARDGGLLHDEDGILVAAPGAPLAWINSVFIKQPLRDPKAQLARAFSHLDERQLPFFVRIREGVDEASERALEALGLRYHESVPGMALSPIPNDGGRETPLEIVRVEDDNRWAHFVDVTVESFGLGDAHLLPTSMRHAPGTQWFVGYLDGEPVAASQLEVIGPIAGVNFIGTLDGHRGRGFGAAVTWQVVNAGAAAGCRFSILQASDMGRPVYERMGFRVVTQYKTFARPEWL